jgi:probable HAF family extracellular repeat protein
MAPGTPVKKEKEEGKMRVFKLWGISLIFGFWLIGTGPGYGEVIDLGTLGGPELNGCAFAVNDRGEAAGYTDTTEGPVHAFVYSGGTMKDLGTLGGGWSIARGINSQGQVVGYAATNQGVHHAFLYSAGQMTDLGVIGDRWCSSIAYGINDNGQIVGETCTPEEDRRAFLYDNGRMIDLGTLGGRQSFAYGLNIHGQVVGSAQVPSGDWHASLWTPEAGMQDLGTLGGPSSIGRAINSQGWIVGQSDTTDGHYRAFLYVDGVMTDLGTLGGSSSVATGINDRGQVTGFAARSGETDYFFLYENGRMIDLNIWCQAYGINNSGHIVGESVLNYPYHHPILYIPPNLPPRAEAGPDQEVECAGPEGTVVTLDGSGSSDPDGDPLTYTWTGPFGTGNGLRPTVTLPVGVYIIQLTVSDGRGGSSADSVTITVQDETAPKILALAAHPNRLWPPNHWMVPVHIQVSAEDACDTQPVCRITSVSSNQPEGGRGAGARENDWGIVDDLTVKLRAERSGREADRIYTLTVECADQNGNRSSGTTTVTVPHDQKKFHDWFDKAADLKKMRLR